MSEDSRLAERILRENRSLHAIEAASYERLHPEEFNWFEQARIDRDLKFICSSLSSRQRALDLGCGTGHLSLKILKACGCSLDSVDISKEMLAALSARLTAADRQRVRLGCRDAEGFIADCRHTFDLIAMSSVLHHFPGYLETLRRVTGLLSPGGWLYITHEPTSDSLGPDPFARKILWQLDYATYWLRLRGKLPSVKGERDYHMSDYNLYHGFDEEAVVSVCRDAGLRTVRFEKYASCMRLGVSCWIDTHIVRSRRQFSLIARKS